MRSLPATVLSALGSCRTHNVRLTALVVLVLLLYPLRSIMPTTCINGISILDASIPVISPSSQSDMPMWRGRRMGT